MSFFELCEEEKTKIILKESKTLEDVLNKDLLKRFGELHNIKDDFNLFKLKQEVIAKTGLFLDVKKKYALHIINKEGVPKDELYIKGLVTERSDYPPITRQRIKTVIELLLKTDNMNFTNVKEEIEKTKAEIYTLCKAHSREISNPAKYNKEVYKKVPYQVKAMQLWNDIMYSFFVPGTKGYLFRIKGVDFSLAPDSMKEHMELINSTKPRYIAVPPDEMFLPDFFILDIDATMKFCWEDRVKEILKPIENMIFERKKEEEVILWE